MMKNCAVLLSLLLLLPSCWIARGQVNEPIDALALQQLRPKQSTAADVTRLLGGPVEVVQLGRRSAYLYLASTEKTANLFAFACDITEGVFFTNYTCTRKPQVLYSRDFFIVLQ